MLIDTHTHLDFESFSADFDDVLLRAKESRVLKFIIPAASSKTLKRAIMLSEKYPNIYFSIGTHPNDATEYEESLLREHINHPKCVAVGECGLDYHYLPKDEIGKKELIKRQKEIFIDQIEIAKEFKKPLIVHIREASRDSKEILEKYDAKTVGGILHCYNADAELLSLANSDFYFGIGGVVTFSNARRLLEILPKIPQDKIVLETDAPFLTPHPHRGKRNEPSYITFIAQKIADELCISFEEVCKITTQNAKRVFKEL